ncbi:MAG TPA: cyclodeaminase/cyclohydrolase family protein [Candidatus Limnocylindria bacterium]
MEDPTDNLSNLTLRDLTARLASREPIPGGGSASALAGALGASLVAMVAELTIGRPDASEHEPQLVGLRDEATAHRELLLDLAEQDARAYGAVVAARRMPKTTDEERASRSEAMRRTMLAAAEVPLLTAGAALDVLELARTIAPIGNPNAVSDAGVAAELAAAAVRGAILNVRINLPYLPAEEPLRAAAPETIANMERRTADAQRSVADAVSTRMASR